MIVRRKQEFVVKRKQFVVRRKELSCVKMHTAEIYFIKAYNSGKFKISYKPYYMPKHKAIRLKMKLERVFYGKYDLIDK